MRYFLWIDGKQDGPYEPAKIREMIDNSRISDTTLAHPEGDIGDWNAIRNYPELFEFLKPLETVLPPPPAPAPVPAFSLPPIEDSGVAVALTTIAVLEFIGAAIVGFVVGSDNVPVGWLVFVSGIISGLILLGFARVIEHLCESAQRLRRIEVLIQKAHDDKNAS